MAESLTTASEKMGLPPGSLIHVGEVLEGKTRLTLINYNKDEFEELEIKSLQDVKKYQHKDGTITWVIMEGLTDTELVESIGQSFGVHPLVLEDIVNTKQRPKLEEHDDYLFIVLKSLIVKGEEFSVEYEQISLLVFEKIVFLFKEKPDGLLSHIIERLRGNKTRIRKFGADYLTYVILDTVVDMNFLLIDELDEKVLSLEEDLLDDTSQDILHRIQKLRREMVSIRRNISPVRELMAGLLRIDSKLITTNTQIYLRDVSDHAIRVIELIESYRDILSSLMDIYISSVSNKLNEVMKVLTIFASIFIPLTFLTGIYGMNFRYMPELAWPWAYPIVWSIFIIIPIVLLVYFRRKRCL